jgi:hypothetical protein
LTKKSLFSQEILTKILLLGKQPRNKQGSGVKCVMFRLNCTSISRGDTGESNFSCARLTGATEVYKLC